MHGRISRVVLSPHERLVRRWRAREERGKRQSGHGVWQHLRALCSLGADSFRLDV